MSTLATITKPSSFLPVGHETSLRVPQVSPFLGDLGSSRRVAVLKHLAQSERLVDVRPASRLEVRPKPEMISSGIEELDALTGGLPRGCLTEICGGPSCGKTSVLLATLAAVTARGESCVLIDASDSFDPNSGAAAGVDFGKLLWVRCGESSLGNNASSVVRRRSSAKNHERHLEQVLKSTDLILQSGGFGLVALDLTGIPEKFVRRIPLASWFRFQRAVEHTKTTLLAASEISCAQTCAALVVKVCGKPSAVSHQPSGKPSHAEVLKEFQIEAEIMRTRLERKPMQSVTASFRTQAVRAG